MNFKKYKHISMAEISKYKENIKELQTKEKQLNEESLTYFKEYLDYILPEGKGEIYFSKKKEPYTLPYSHFSISHIFYDKYNNICEAHIDNCAEALPLTKTCAGDIIAAFNKLYFK